MSNFKLIFIGIFAVAAIFGVLVFSGIITIGASTSTQTDVSGTVVIWGTFDSQAMTGFVQDFNTNNAKIHITYQQKDAATFDQTLVEAIASGTPPDLVLLPDSLVWRFSDKLTHIPFASLPAQTFQDTFIGAANVFSVSDGSLAVPWASDPLIMFYNRDLLESVGIAQVPATWKPFADSIPLLTKKKSDLTLIQMGAALGTYKNILHAKDIISLLFMQSGNQFVSLSAANQPTVHFGAIASANENAAAQSAINFYTGFASPLSQAYTWNAGEPTDRNEFTQSLLAYYFGTASEVPLIRAQNPNLNFAIALPPQQASGTPMTTGHIYGFAIPKSAPNQLLSFTATTLLSNSASESALPSKLGTTLSLMPVRRDILAEKPVSDPYLGLLYQATLVQKTWLDPNPAGSDQVFATLISDLGSAFLPTDQALSKAAAQITALSAKI